MASKCVPGSQVVVPSEETSSHAGSFSHVKRMAARTLSLLPLSKTSPRANGRSLMPVSSRIRANNSVRRLWWSLVLVLESDSPWCQMRPRSLYVWPSLVSCAVTRLMVSMKFL